MSDIKRCRITVAFEPKDYENIKRIAASEGLTINQQIRNFCKKGINGQVTSDNADELILIMREQIRDVMKPSVERLAALSAKGCMQSYTASLLCAESINRFVPENRQEDVQDAYEKAKKKAVQLMRKSETV